MTVTFSLDILPIRLHVGALTVRVDDAPRPAAAGAPAAQLGPARRRLRDGIKFFSNGWCGELFAR